MKVQVTGLRELRRALKEVDKDLPKELRAAHKDIAVFVAGRAQGAASGRAKGAIRPRATQKAAKIALTSGRRGDALAVMMGQRRRSGWYGYRRYQRSKARQFRPWVGNQWDPGETGGQPYEVGPAINASLDEVVEMYGDAIDRLVTRAGFR